MEQQTQQPTQTTPVEAGIKAKDCCHNHWHEVVFAVIVTALLAGGGTYFALMQKMVKDRAAVAISVRSEAQNEITQAQSQIEALQNKIDNLGADKKRLIEQDKDPIYLTPGNCGAFKDVLEQYGEVTEETVSGCDIFTLNQQIGGKMCRISTEFNVLFQEWKEGGKKILGEIMNQGWEHYGLYDGDRMGNYNQGYRKGKQILMIHSTWDYVDEKDDCGMGVFECGGTNKDLRVIRRYSITIGDGYNREE